MTHKPFFIIVFLALLITGCSSNSKMQEWLIPNGKVKVLSTTAMLDDIVGGIGGDRVDHVPLIVGEIDPHSYELVKGDDEKLSFAGLIFYNGLGLEHGASLRYALEHHSNAVALGNKIQAEDSSLILNVGSDIDPHIWMDISLWSRTIDPIVEALSQMDPQGKDAYLANGEMLKKKMQQEHASIRKALEAVPEQKRYLVTSHDAFNYFTRAYLAQSGETEEQWRSRFDAPEGLAPEGQLSTADIQAIIDHLMKYKIHVVFPESNVSRDSLKKIVHACRQKGLEVKISPDPLYGDAMGNKGGAADDYLKMIRYDADVMIKEWR